MTIAFDYFYDSNTLRYIPKGVSTRSLWAPFLCDFMSIFENNSGYLFVVEEDNPFAHCTQFLARSRLGPLECPNSPHSAAQTADIRPSGGTSRRQDGTPQIALGSLQDHLPPPMPYRRTFGV